MSDTQIHRVPYPFVRKEYDGPLDGEFVDGALTWTPGTRWIQDSPYDDGDQVADGMGFMLLTLVSAFKPGKYPERTFYVRQFQDPAGRVFGKTQLRVIASSAFKAMLKGYRHRFDLADAVPETSQGEQSHD